MKTAKFWFIASGGRIWPAPATALAKEHVIIEFSELRR